MNSKINKEVSKMHKEGSIYLVGENRFVDNPFLPSNVVIIADPYTDLPVIKMLQGRGYTYDYTRDYLILLSYGRIIPDVEIDSFNGTLYNLHPSPLPFYPGPDPIGVQLLAGEVASVMTLQEIQSGRGVDQGRIVATTPMKLDDKPHLMESIVKHSTVEILNKYFNKPITRTHKVTTEDKFVQLNDAVNKLRYWSYHNIKPLIKIAGREVALDFRINLSYNSTRGAKPGLYHVDDALTEQLLLNTGRLTIAFHQVTISGKATINFKDYINQLKGQGYSIDEETGYIDVPVEFIKADKKDEVAAPKFSQYPHCNLCDVVFSDATMNECFHFTGMLDEKLNGHLHLCKSCVERHSVPTELNIDNLKLLDENM